MSDSNLMALRYVEETAFGVTPSGPPTFKETRFTGEGFGLDANFIESAEIRVDRQVADVIRASYQAGGDLSGELSYGAHDDLLEAGLLSSDWSTPVTNTGTFAAVNSTGKFTGSGVETGISVGDWVRWSDEGAIVSFHKVVAVGSGEITVLPAPANVTGDGDEEVEAGGYIANGTELRWMSWEKEFTDNTNDFALLTGMAIESLGLNIEADQIVTLKTGWLGKNETSETATAGDGSPTAAATGSVMNAIDNVVAIYEGGTALGSTKLSIELKNNLRARTQIATDGLISIGKGSVGLTGTIESYYASASQYSKFLGDTSSGLSVVFLDGSSNAVCIDMPKVKFTSARRVAGAKDGEVMAVLGFTAYRSPVQNQTIRITRWPV